MNGSYKRITLRDRISIEVGIALGKSFTKIADELGFHKSSISREVNFFGRKKYRAVKAHRFSKAAARLRKHNKTKLASNKKLLNYILEKLDLRWSPQQISQQLKKDFPNDESMRVSHECIYQYIYLASKKGLRACLSGKLRQKKKKRGRPRKKSEEKRGRIPDAISIEERPKEVDDRMVPGHWEGDLIIGKDHKSAIGTLTERTTRTLIIVPLKSYDATTVRKRFEEEFATIPLQMKKTLTYDNGKEMSEHKLFTSNSKIKVYFAHPYSPWERPTNENINGLIRDYYPKGTDFNKISKKELKRVQNELNERPRKVLNWDNPKEAFAKELEKLGLN